MKLHIAIKKAEANPLLSFYIIESHRRLNVIAESEWHQADYIPYKNMDYIHAKRDDMRRTAMIYHCIRNEQKSDVSKHIAFMAGDQGFEP